MIKVVLNFYVDLFYTKVAGVLKGENDCKSAVCNYLMEIDVNIYVKIFYTACRWAPLKILQVLNIR